MLNEGLLTALAALGGVVAKSVFDWLAKRGEWRSTKPKVETDALVAANDKLGDLADRFEQLWRQDHERISGLERRMSLLEAEIVRLGGDPASINGSGG